MDLLDNELNPDTLIRALVKMMNPKMALIGVSKLRLLNRKAIRALDGPLFVEVPKSKVPIAVIIPYEDYLRVQNALFGRSNNSALDRATGPLRA